MQDSSEGFSLSFGDASLADGDLAAHWMRLEIFVDCIVGAPGDRRSFAGNRTTRHED